MLNPKIWKWFPLFFSFWTGYAIATEKPSTVVQVSTIPAMLKGIYEGNTTFAQLKTFGNFGFGTINGLDGEMAAFDGQFYLAKADGSVQIIPDSQKTPFATVHFFRADKIVTLTNPIQTYTDFKNRLTQLLPNQNRPYALKITATFDYLKTRSVPKQHKPYPPLAEVAKHQTIFKFENISGTAVGYWFPDYLDKLNIADYHLHFISENKQHGGHILDCRFSKATIAIDFIDSIHFLIPPDEIFQNADLSDYSLEDLRTVEKDPIEK
jgi:acetolactate decarboxylase